MKLTKNNFYIYLKKVFCISTFSFFAFINGSLIVSAQESYILNDIEMNNSTKSDVDNSLEIPSNPFQMVEMIRRATSMNDATSPSDAIDDALKLFDMIENNEEQ